MYRGSVYACINKSWLSCTDGLYYSDCCDIRYGQLLLVDISCTYASDMWNLYISIRSRDRSPVVSLWIFSVVPSDKTMCPEVDSAFENEYQGFLLG